MNGLNKRRLGIIRLQASYPRGYARDEDTETLKETVAALGWATWHQGTDRSRTAAGPSPVAQRVLRPTRPQLYDVFAHRVRVAELASHRLHLLEPAVQPHPADAEGRAGSPPPMDKPTTRRPGPSLYEGKQERSQPAESAMPMRIDSPRRSPEGLSEPARAFESQTVVRNRELDPPLNRSALA